MTDSVQKHSTVWRWTGMAVGVLVMLCAGSPYSFNASVNTLKQTYFFSQSDVNLIANLANVGTCFASPAGYIVKRYGAWAGCMAAAVLSGASYLFVAASATRGSIRALWLWELLLTVGAHGLIYLYIAALLVNTRNFPENRQGLVIGILDCAFGFSGLVFSAIFSLVGSTAGQSGSVGEGSVEQYYLVIAVSSCICAFLGTLLLRDVPLMQADSTGHASLKNMAVDSPEYAGDSADAGNESIQDVASEKESEQARLLEGVQTNDTSSAAKNDSVRSLTLNLPSQTTLVFKCWSGWLVYLWFFLLQGITLFYMNNVTSILKSNHLEKDSNLHAMLLPAVGGICRVVAGVVSDILIEKTNKPRYVLLRVASYSTLPLFVLLLAAGDNRGVLVLCTMLVGASFGVSWCITPLSIMDVYGQADFGVNWGFTIFASALGGITFGELGGKLYDDRVPHGQDMCYGKDCFRTIFIVCIVTAGVLCVLQEAFVLMFNRRLQRHQL